MRHWCIKEDIRNRYFISGKCWFDNSLGERETARCCSLLWWYIVRYGCNNQYIQLVGGRASFCLLLPCDCVTSSNLWWGKWNDGIKKILPARLTLSLSLKSISLLNRDTFFLFYIPMVNYLRRSTRIFRVCVLPSRIVVITHKLLMGRALRDREAPPRPGTTTIVIPVRNNKGSRFVNVTKLSLYIYTSPPCLYIRKWWVAHLCIDEHCYDSARAAHRRDDDEWTRFIIEEL